MDPSQAQTVVIPGTNIVMPLLAETWQWLVGLWPSVVVWTKAAISFAVVVSVPLSVAFLIGIVYCVERLKEIRAKEKEKFDVKKIEPAFEEIAAAGNRDLTVRWQKANSLLNSDNPNDWKQAILEADTMLLDILTGLGYQGDGVGEKLKRVEPGEMKTIDDAWEAHKVRNQIAHEPGFALNHHEAVQTMHRFRRVFEEFYYI